MSGRSSLRIRSTPLLRTEATCTFAVPAPAGALWPTPPTVSARPVRAATAAAAAPATTTRRRARRRATGRARLPGGAAWRAAGPRSPAGACSGSWRPPARSPLKSSALGGASEAAKVAGEASSGGRWGSASASRRPNGTSSSRGPIQSPSRTTLGEGPLLPSVVCGTSLSTPLLPLAGISASSQFLPSGLGGIV